VATKLHDIFHVGLLKHYYDDTPEGPGILPPICHGRACLEPESVIKSRLSRGHHKLLVIWKGLTTTDTTWTDLKEFRSLYLSFQLEDKLIVQGGRDVMWGTQYVHKKSKKPAPSQELATK
jgi:hypothetical protein